MISITKLPFAVVLLSREAQLSLATSSSIPSPTHTIDWNNITAISNTTATLQVVANPILNRKISPIAGALFQKLQELQADLVRYVPWFPYPQYAVAELDPPTATRSSWHFSEELQQQFLDVFYAVTNNNDNKRVVINFSTQPTWMFNTSQWDYPRDDPNQVDWGYVRGTAIPNITSALVAQYYGRLASWIVNGELTDEFGTTIGGGPALGKAVTHWEIFNEPEGEHSIDPLLYNEFFDKIVREIRKQVDTNIQFVGMALEGHNEFGYWESFLAPEHHAPDVRDAVAHGMASFHWYGHVSSRTNISTYIEPFEQMPAFWQEVDRIVDLRNRLNPTTRLSVNEAGVIAPDDNNDANYVALPNLYYHMVAAVYTVLLAELSVRGVEVVGSSQFCGNPAIPEWNITNAMFPSVSMTNWTTGDGNARYYALKLLLAYVGPGDRIVQTTTTNSNYNNVYVQARITANQKKIVLLVNKSLQTQVVDLTELQGAVVQIVDEDMPPWGERSFVSDTTKLSLKRFAVAVVVVRKSGDLDGDLAVAEA